MATLPRHQATTRPTRTHLPVKRVRETRLRTLSVSEAVGILEALGSATDPIWRHGIECSPPDLEYADDTDGFTAATRVHILYAGGPASAKWRRGTLQAMVTDRLIYA